MKARETMIRLQKWQIDEIRRKLADLETMRAQFEAKRNEIQETMLDERRFGETSPIGAFAYPSYARAMAERRAKLEQSIAGIAREIEATKNVLADAFGELKKSEILEGNRKERERETRERQEQAGLDEMALKTFRRRQLEGQA